MNYPNLPARAPRPRVGQAPNRNDQDAGETSRPGCGLSRSDRAACAPDREHRDGVRQRAPAARVVFNALAEAGLFRLWLPEALGGPQLSPADFMTVVEAASALDGSVGWLVGNGGGMSRIGGYLPEPVARNFSPTRAHSSRAPPVRSARRRRWRVAIASPAAGRSEAAPITRRTSWASRARKAPTARTSRRCAAISNRRDVVVHDTWLVSGLRATGSCDFEVRDLFVPEQHTHIFMGARPTQDGIVYRLPACRYSPGPFPSFRSVSRAAR